MARVPAHYLQSMPQVCKRIKESYMNILDMTALQAEGMADAVHAPKPEQARSEAFKRISEACKKGHYNAWVTVRGVDLRQLCLDLLKRGFDIESYGTPDRDDFYTVQVTWGNASLRHILQRLQMHIKTHYFTFNQWPKSLWIRQDEYDEACLYYKAPKTVETVLGIDVAVDLFVDNSPYNA